MTKNVIIIGASSAIAEALTLQLLEMPDIHLFAISRQARPQALDNQNVSWIQTDHTPANIADILANLKLTNRPISQVFICSGMLHHHDVQPEKKIEQFNEFQFNRLMQVNVLIPTYWIQQLIDACKHTEPCAITVFSARVGSISDNRLGGWYSYRMSKAALNMMLKTAAVEYARRAKNVKLIAFHPGTTDTPLSKPFQANVASDKLFTPQFVASQLLKIIKGLAFDNQAQFIDWEGKNINW